MNSITKCAPVFNANTGIISYKWDDIVQEHPSCPRCGEAMGYWYSRKRGVIISEQKYIFMAPRFKCSCGCTLTMRPYFIVSRKQYSVFAIQDILKPDAYHEKSITSAYGSSFVANLRKWAVAVVMKSIPILKEQPFPDERHIIRMLYQKAGAHWLTSILQNITKSQPFTIAFILSG